MEFVTSEIYIRGMIDLNRDLFVFSTHHRCEVKEFFY